MAAVVVALTVVLLVQDPGPVMASATTRVERADDAAGGAQSPTLMYVLGDELSSDETARFDEKGEPLLGTARDWPAIVSHELDWDLVSDISSGGGYLSPGGGGTIGDRAVAVDRGADVIVLVGGGHDLREHSADEISAAVEDAVVSLLDDMPTAEIVLTSPLPPDVGEWSTVPTASVDEVCRALRVLARRDGVAYVDLTTSVSSGAAGTRLHEVVAERMVRALRDLESDG